MVQMPDHQVVLDTAAVQTLIARLDLEPDEVCVVSIIAATTPSSAVIVFGSILFGPPQMAQMSWEQWAARTYRPATVRVQQWNSTGLDPSRWRTFDIEHAGWRLQRAEIPISDVPEWLADLLCGRQVVLPGTSTPLRASARSATALVQTFPHLATPSALLALSAHRPVLGYHFPLEPGVDFKTAPMTWEPDGWWIPNAPAILTGLPMSDPPLHTGTGAPARPGFLVGCLQRRAWITEIRTVPESGVCSVGIGHAQERVDLADLEIEMEEYLDGDLVAARRLRLGDVQLPTRPIAADATVRVDLPTLGSGIHRRLRLVDRDGVLLDTTDAMPTIEKISVAIAGPNDSTTLLETSERHSIVNLTKRLAEADRAESEYGKLLQDGIRGRIVTNEVQGQILLAEALSVARGHLDILDPYFGHNTTDWSVLRGVSVPVRVLTWERPTKPSKQGRPTPAPKPAPAPTNAVPHASLEFRAWHDRSAPWHDRVYLWDGGGLSVGTSPSGLGKRLARIDRLSAAETAGWQQFMNAWWFSPHTSPV